MNLKVDNKKLLTKLIKEPQSSLSDVNKVNTDGFIADF